MSGCWVCNPYCGKCKTAMLKPVRCTVCGKFNMPEADCTCKKCGAKLPDLAIDSELPNEKLPLTENHC